MTRLIATLCALIALALLTVGSRADDKADNKDKPQRGEFSKMDPGAGTLTVKMKDKDGKPIEKTFKLTKETKGYDVDGEERELDVFRSGDQILVLSRKGEVNELRKAGRPMRAEIVNIDLSAGTVRVKMKDENNREVEKTFRLTGEVRYMDSLGRAATAQMFQAGDEVAVIVNKGRLQEISQSRK